MDIRSTDLVGKRGLEQLLEEKLRGEDGVRIYIEKTDHNAKITIAEKPAVDGEKVTLTIDADLQKATFEAMDMNREPLQLLIRKREKHSF